MFSDEVVCLVLLVTGMLLSILCKKLTISAAITGGITGWLVFKGAGFTGICMMTAFFLLGAIATSWKLASKLVSGLAEKNKRRRSAGQVAANAGIAAIMGIIVWIFPLVKEVAALLIAASFASATADTMSSELGNVYGSRFYNIVTFKRDQRGRDGVVSIEGTLLGLAGSIFIALIYTIGFGAGVYSAIIIIAAGTIGNIADSLLGATAERKQLVENNMVNFLNTAIAVITAAFLHYWYS